MTHGLSLQLQMVTLNLSKVAIHIPNNNKGTNDNDETGIVNKEISIAVGNDINT